MKKKIPEQQLQQFNTHYVDHHNLYYKLYPEDFSYMKKTRTGEVETSKCKINFHLTNHYPTVISFFGAPTYFSLEVFEHSIKYLKKAHKNTNGKNPSENVPHCLLDHNLGIYCDMTYDEFTAKHTKNNIKWKKNKVNDPLLYLGVHLHHYNSITIQSLKIYVGDTIALQGDQFALVKEIWGNKDADFASAKIKVEMFSTSTFAEVPIWKRLELLPNSFQIIDAVQVSGKKYMWIWNGNYLCEPMYSL
jgi:hypothetical protein